MGILGTHEQQQFISERQSKIVNQFNPKSLFE